MSLWKGLTKPLASFALGAVALGAFVHYITVGPKDEPVDDDDMDPRDADPADPRRSTHDRHEVDEARRPL